MNTKNNKMKTALILGSSKGIGKAIFNSFEKIKVRVDERGKVIKESTYREISTLIEKNQAKEAKIKPDTRLVIQQGSQDTLNTETQDLVDKLKRKNSGTEIVVVKQETGKEPVAIQGKIADLTGRVKVQVSGDGDIGKLAGKDGKEIASEVQNIISSGGPDAKLGSVTLLSCKSGTCDEKGNSLAKDVQEALGPNIPVKGFKDTILTDDDGRTYTQNDYLEYEQQFAADRKAAKSKPDNHVIIQQGSDPVVQKSTEDLVKKLKRKNPDTPVLLVQNG